MSENIPKNWRTTQLGEITSIVSGGTPARESSEFWGNDIPWVTPTDITNTKGRFLFNTSERLSFHGLNSSSASPLPSGTILMTSRATVGDARIAAREVCTNQGFKSLIPNRDIDGLFLFYQMQRCREAYKVYGIGSTFLEVSKKDTERFELLLPNDLVEQQAISKILDCVDLAGGSTVEIIHKYQQIKAGVNARLVYPWPHRCWHTPPLQRTSPGALSRNSYWLDSEGVECTIIKRNSDIPTWATIPFIRLL